MSKKAKKSKIKDQIAVDESSINYKVKSGALNAVKVVVALIVVILGVFIAIKVGFGSSDDIEFSDANLVKSDIQPSKGILINNAGLTEFANNGELKMEYSPSSDLFVITHLKSGKVFRSYPEPLSELEYGEDSDILSYSGSRETGKRITSPVYIGYTKSGMDGGFSVGVNQFTEVTKTVHYIDNGIRLQYEIKDIACEVNVEITLDGNALRYKVPYNGIIERRTYAQEEEDRRPLITSISVLPLFAAHRDGDEGCFVTPDGSGAITYFDVARITNYSEYAKMIYGGDYTFSDNSSPDFNNLIAPMGVYGIIEDDYMISSYIVSGESEAMIRMSNPGIYNLPYYSIYYQFNYRYFYKLQISKGGTAYDMVVKNKHIGDVEQITYIDVATEDEDKTYNYVDLALKTRGILVEKWGDKWGITDKQAAADPSALNVKIFMGAENMFGGLVNTVNVMTTFNDVKEIYGAIEAMGISNIRLSLLGWQKNGYYGNATNKYKPEGDLGGKKDLENLLDWVDDKGVDISLDNNLLILYGSPKKGATLRNSVVKKPNTFYLNYNLLTTSGIYRANTGFYLLSPKYYDAKLLEKDLDKLSDYGVSAVDLQQVGNMIYSDYNQENATLRADVIAMYVNWIKEYSEELGSVGIYGGNEYAVAVADYILDIAMDKSSSILLDEQIPFIQIVYHGLINYYSEPINRMDSEKYSILKSVEYGALMSYELTKEKSSELQYTYYNRLFKSQYDLLLNDIKEVYDIAQEAIVPFASQSIVDHYKVSGSESVFCTVYSGGAHIYVNYDSEAFTLENGNVVESMDYIIVS